MNRISSAMVFLAGSLIGWANSDWLPIPPEELALKSIPGYPDEKAVILWRAEETNDQKGESRHYYRIKILSEEGRKFADIEIPYSKYWKVDEIAARTVRPDGAPVEFDGVIYDRTLIKTRGSRVYVKSFTLPGVQPGSIIEYRYRRKWSDHYLPTVWEVQDELYTRHVHFSLKPAGDEPLHYATYNASKEFALAQPNGAPQLDLDNVPAFAREEYAPPPALVKPKIEFFYQSIYLTWPLLFEEASKAIDKFAGKPQKFQGLVTQITSASDPPEQKLRKLYARAQEIRNLSFEPRRTKDEKRSENLKSNGSAEDVLKHGYGTGTDINLLFLALARAAGFEASEMFLVTRDSGWFDPRVVSFGRFNARVIKVMAGGKAYYLDPATRFCPFGLLPWEETDSAGIVASTGAYPDRVPRTPPPLSSDAIVERVADLELSPDGAVEGNLEVLFHGQEALQRRLTTLEMDDAGRSKSLEEEITGWFPAGASVKIDGISGWNSSEEPLKVKVKLRIPDFASNTGRRLLLPAAPARTHRKDAFAHPTRVYPVYFAYAYQEKDRLQIHLPKEFHLESVPPPQKSETDFSHYDISARTQADGTLLVQRALNIDRYFVNANVYAQVKQFMANVRKGDEQQIVIQVQQ